MAKSKGVRKRHDQTKLDRVEFGHLFRWQKETGCWQSTSGHLVKVFPSNLKRISPWQVLIPGKSMVDEFTGKNAEASTFRAAVSNINPES